jgi:hypothetical protein
MAQVNSSPGQNQAFGNVAVASATSETGVTSTKAAANATIVPYMQAEPGKQPSDRNPVRK